MKSGFQLMACNLPMDNYPQCLSFHFFLYKYAPVGSPPPSGERFVQNIL